MGNWFVVSSSKGRCLEWNPFAIQKLQNESTGSWFREPVGDACFWVCWAFFIESFGHPNFRHLWGFPEATEAV